MLCALSSWHHWSWHAGLLSHVQYTRIRLGGCGLSGEYGGSVLFFQDPTCQHQLVMKIAREENPWVFCWNAFIVEACGWWPSLGPNVGTVGQILKTTENFYQLRCGAGQDTSLFFLLYCAVSDSSWPPSLLARNSATSKFWASEVCFLAQFFKINRGVFLPKSEKVVFKMEKKKKLFQTLLT